VRGLTDDSAPSPGDPQLVAAAIIAAGGAEVAPLRVVLGGDSYRHVVAALRERLADVGGRKTRPPRPTARSELAWDASRGSGTRPPAVAG
jgi:hypothetical protein